MKPPTLTLGDVLESASRLQQVVPDAVVGGSAAAFYASHRTSFDHDHVSAMLAAAEQYEADDGT